MFVTGEAHVDADFATALGRLASQAREGALLAASREAYEKESRHLARVGPFDGTPGLSRLVDVQFADPVTHGDTTVLALRWEASGRGGDLFPALDADITLVPVDEHTSLLRLSGVYRPPFGPAGAALDRILLHRVATATIQAFVDEMADVIAGSGHGTPPAAHTRGSIP
jgi:hypothetical protein